MENFNKSSSIVIMMTKADDARYIKHRAVVMYHNGQHLEATFRARENVKKLSFFNPDEIPLTYYFRGTVYWLWSVRPVAAAVA